MTLGPSSAHLDLPEQLGRVRADRWIGRLRTVAATGLAMPSAPTLALSRHGEAAGTAAALLGAVQFGVGAIAVPLVGILGASAVGMTLVMVAGGMVAANLVLPRSYPAPALVVAGGTVAAHWSWPWSCGCGGCRSTRSRPSRAWCAGTSR
jgi:hypothetical protein